MTEQEALAAALYRSSGLDQLHPNDAFGAGFHAALAWLRSQNEPVGRFNWETGEFEFLVPWDYETHNMKPLYLAPEPAIPDGWLDRGKAALAECRAADDLWSDDRLLSHLFNAMTTAPEPAIPDGWQSVAARDVLAERRRQVEAEGWTPKHDDRHGDRSLVLAAACYAKQYVGRTWLVESLSDGEERYKCDRVPDDWPDSWAEEWWKPKDPRRDLVRAAALLLAEIERLDRTSTAAPKPGEST